MSFGMKISRALRFLEIPVKNRASVNFLRNPDLQPIKSVNQTWGFWSNFAYWGVLSFNVGMWIGGSSALTVGLSYSETIGAFIIADLLTILFALANSCPGYDWKVGFTLAQRFVFGIYGSALGIIIRILMSIVYYGSNAWLGGLCVNMILDSWSHHYLHLPNTLSSKVAMTTKELIGFIIFHILTAFCYFMKPYHMNYILIWSCVGTFFAMLGMVIYLTKSAHGVGDLFTSTHSTVTGSRKAWAWVYTISYWYGSVSPGCTNQSDFSRFGSSNCAIWTGTIVALLIPATLIPVFGIIGASACEKLYGQTFWMPMDIFDNWLTTNYSAGARAATFFCGFCFVMSQISYTISNCGFASGMDLAGLLPKYVDIKRGAIFAACVSWACLPWNFYNSSSTFLTVMSSFGVVMTPIITVMICDNFLIRKRQYSVTNAFVLKGEYYFTKGVNWRAIVAWVCGMAPGLPGIAWEVNNDYFHNTGIINFFYGDSFFSFLISFFVYWGLCLLFPFKITVKHDDKDYYGAFTDEEARKKGMVPYSEISEEEICAYTLGECFTSGHEYKPESSDDELPELTKTSSENTKVFEIVHQKDNEKESSTSSEKQIA
ncbi:CQS_1a_G0050760.mRNA.1.CDS.1 [Saccharomyces cerevisiae]|nr:CQS_1a_G0050760.mRNA.1.CDS.1 [Saccharomyces cerevisiae]CAI5332390.1 ALI_HP2_G0050050.mRNA.1.CDS.1 [Saccharomyces cerevisiae]CAI6776172.1 ALI_HP2_G0050050.mRNA.1.CDS.1 [Saccharomyces cerevisiae]CAI6788694.1 ALI_HP1_G0050780.mRNA.1.CDS.1 [Saccharomyces cerevisiae]CAI6893764.1 ALI_collapsed_G0052400.mRNA.1.CDS.1 [Saccharomyces cerevisiae]